MEPVKASDLRPIVVVIILIITITIAGWCKQVFDTTLAKTTDIKYLHTCCHCKTLRSNGDVKSRL